jgi:hypothetical protein
MARRGQTGSPFGERKVKSRAIRCGNEMQSRNRGADKDENSNTEVAGVTCGKVVAQLQRPVELIDGILAVHDQPIEDTTDEETGGFVRDSLAFEEGQGLEFGIALDNRLHCGGGDLRGGEVDLSQFRASLNDPTDLFISHKVKRGKVEVLELRTALRNGDDGGRGELRTTREIQLQQVPFGLAEERNSAVCELGVGSKVN